jgi:hypothetical protein
MEDIMERTFSLNDVVEMKKQHPCGTNQWKIVRVGADIRIKCQGCNHSVLLPRKAFELKMKKIKTVENKDLSRSNVDNNSCISPSFKTNEKDFKDYNFKDQSELYQVGYRITGLKREQRWELLNKAAIPKLGLYKVVYIIATHIKNRKKQLNGNIKFKYAISEWEYDLEKLKKEYNNHNFDWPNY